MTDKTVRDMIDAKCSRINDEFILLGEKFADLEIRLLEAQTACEQIMREAGEWEATATMGDYQKGHLDGTRALLNMPIHEIIEWKKRAGIDCGTLADVIPLRSEE